MQNYAVGPSSPSPAAIDPTSRPIAAGDFFEIVVGAPVGSARSFVQTEDLARVLLSAGIATDAAVTYTPGDDGQGSNGVITITGRAADDWRGAPELCAEVLKLIASTGYAMNLAQLSCIVTPSAPATPSFEIPGWVLLLLIAGGLWLLWKNSKE